MQEARRHHSRHELMRRFPEPKIRHRVGIYAIDQDPEKTRSKGIYNYTRNLMRALAQLPDPGFRLVLVLSQANVGDLLPAESPTWVSAYVASGAFGRGVRRLLADNVLVRILSSRLELDLLHFPKGWLPIPVPRRPRIVATLHDAIPVFYRRAYPRIDPWRFRYFAWHTVRTLREADVVITGSQASAHQLAELDAARSSRVRVVVDGPGLRLPHPLPVPGGPREGILVLGSLAPHKQTCTTLKLIQAWAEARSTDVRITLVGLERLPPDWHIPSEHVTFRFLGRVSDARLIEEYQRARALVLLSEIEGFGLPALESYALGTPVCYRAIPALVEILDGAPGWWNGDGEQTFFRALDETLALSASQVALVRERLLATYSWQRCARATADEYRRALGVSAAKPVIGTKDFRGI